MNMNKYISALAGTCKALGAQSIRISLYPESETVPVHFDICGVSDHAAEQLAGTFDLKLKRRSLRGQSWLAAEAVRDGVYLSIASPMTPAVDAIDENEVAKAVQTAASAAAP